MKELLCGKDIIKSFGTGSEKQDVLNRVSVKIEEGEFVSVMGPSGSGKSTLLYALSGMDCIESGSVTLGGQELSEMTDEALSDVRRTRMGFVFQQPTLLKNLSILDNIILPAMRENRKKIKMLTEKGRALMKRTGIEGLEDRDITQMSGGQLQRAGICRALMSEPKIIFGDEPTGALNSQSAKEIMELFRQIHEDGTAILLVTHDVNVAAQSGRVLFMQDGEITSELKFPKYEAQDHGKRVEQLSQKMRYMGI